MVDDAVGLTDVVADAVVVAFDVDVGDDTFVVVVEWVDAVDAVLDGRGAVPEISP